MKKTNINRINKLLSVILSLVLIFSNITVFESKALAEDTIYPTGDVNEDDDINASDALAVLNCVTKKQDFDNLQMLYGDLTMNGKIDAIDALIILRHAARISNIPFDAKPEVPVVSQSDVIIDVIECDYIGEDEYYICLHSDKFDSSAFELNLYYENIDIVSYEISNEMKYDLNITGFLDASNNVEEESYVSFAGAALSSDYFYEGTVAEIIVKSTDPDANLKLVDGLTGVELNTLKLSDINVSTPEPSEEPTPTSMPYSGPASASISYENGTAVISIDTKGINFYDIGVKTDVACTIVEYDSSFTALGYNNNYMFNTLSNSASTDSKGNVYAVITGVACCVDGSDIPYEGTIARFTYENVEEGTEFIVVSDTWNYDDVNNAPIITTLIASNKLAPTTEPSNNPSIPIISLGNKVNVNSNAYQSDGMYKFIPDDNGTYKFYSNVENVGANYIEAKLCDSNFDEIDYYSFATNMGFDFAIEAELNAGETYFIDINTYLGDYILSVEKLPKIEKLEIESLPYKMEYMEGYLYGSLSGLELKATLEDGSVEYWNYDYGTEFLAGYNVSAEILYDEETNSTKGFEANCAGIVIKEDFTILENNVESISIDTAPTRVYYMGDETYGYITDDCYYLSPTDLRGLEFTVTYKDGSSEVLSSETMNNEYYDYIDHDYINQPGEYEVTFSYLGATAVYKIRLVESNVASIEVIKEPNNTIFDNEYLPDFIGMQLKINYSDGASDIVEVNKDNVNYVIEKGYEYFAKVSFDDNEILITKTYDEDCYAIKYLGASCEYNGIEFSGQKVINSIAAKNVSLSPNNISFIITYQDGSTEILDAICSFSYSTTSDSGFNGCILTEKGLLDCIINENYNIDKDTIMYSIYVLGQELEVFPDSDVVDLGDVDENGKIDASDALAILKHAAKINMFNDEQLIKAEVTKDSSVDANDALQILKYAAKIINSFD